MRKGGLEMWDPSGILLGLGFHRLPSGNTALPTLVLTWGRTPQNTATDSKSRDFHANASGFKCHWCETNLEGYPKKERREHNLQSSVPLISPASLGNWHYCRCPHPLSFRKCSLRSLNHGTLDLACKLCAQTMGSKTG